MFQSNLPPLYFLPYQKQNASLNMQIDEMLLNQKTGWFLRLYGWKKPSLSLGKNTRYSEKINLSFCEEHNIPYVRRPSGGSAVLHHHEITYSLVGNSNDIPFNIVSSCQELSLPLLHALQLFSFPVKAQQQTLPLSKGVICFQETSAYEISLFNKKVVGSAQVRKNGRFLQHGSILLQWDAELWSKIGNTSANILKQNIIGLQEVNEDPLLKSKLIQQIPKSFAYCLQKEIVLYEI